MHIRPENPVTSDTLTIRLKGSTSDKDAFGITELAGGAANRMDTDIDSKDNHRLSIVEIDILEDIK